MFNEDLEEIKQSQSIMNNTINEIKSTLEVTSSRITEAENRINEVEDRAAKINESERKKELKEMRTTSETSGTMLNTPHSNHRSTRRRWQKERWILKETIVENLPKIGNEIATQVQETQRLPNRINPR